MNNNLYIVKNLKEIYHEKGSYEVKIILNNKYFEGAHSSNVCISDSDNNEIKSEIKYWGKKIVCNFLIDDNVSDGVATIDMSLCDKNNFVNKHKLYFWVIK